MTENFKIKNFNLERVVVKSRYAAKTIDVEFFVTPHISEITTDVTLDRHEKIPPVRLTDYIKQQNR